jgi:hypothetical protein
MYHVLSRHPNVDFPAGKEVNFWLGPRDRGGLEWYARTMADDDPSVAAGEISVVYDRMSSMRIRNLRRHYPDVRLFLNVRHPVDRAWSRAKMRIRDEKRNLATMTDSEVMPYVFDRSNIEHGDYATNLDRWLEVFPREQLRVVLFDDIAADPSQAMEDLCGHIGVDFEPLRRSRALIRKRVRTAPERPLPDGIRTMLEHLYAEPMTRFRDRYGIDFTGRGRS